MNLRTSNSARCVRRCGLVVALHGLVLAIVGCQNDAPLATLTGSTLSAADTAVDYPEPNTGAPATLPDDAADLRQAVVRAVNAARTVHALPPLRPVEVLDELADYHTTRMIDGNFFSHADPYDRTTVGARAIDFDYPYLKIGEVLAAGQESPEQVAADWLASAAHRATLLDPAFTEIGIAVLDGGQHGRYWTLIVGSRAGS